MWWTDHSLHSLSPYTVQGRRQRIWEWHWACGERRTWGEGVLKFSFYFSLSYSERIYNKIISPRQICFAHDSFGECSSLPALISTLQSVVIFSPPSSWGGQCREPLVGTCSPARVTPPDPQTMEFLHQTKPVKSETMGQWPQNTDSRWQQSQKVIFPHAALVGPQLVTAVGNSGNE